MATFTPEFLDEIRARLRASDVIGRYVKLSKQGREWRGLSPFTNEKTPSFYVNDEKAKFFDFSSGKSGDIIGFLIEQQKLTFPEAVKRLAEEAGLELPRDTPEDARRAEVAKGLVEACQEAAVYFQQMLGRVEGRAAREYLEMRRVPQNLQQTFMMGYAPNARAGLKDYLINKGYKEDLLVEAGLLIRPEDGRGSYDRFRDRVMFPIWSTSNKIIAFGGRALDKDAKAKYLNSPETPLFHKSNVLYNFMAARRAAAELPRPSSNAPNAPLIVCEGYMDVIGLAGAGFGNAVAPLGTALTEAHLGLLWRACDEPIMCFDGDRAGRGAAYRSIDRALPLLKPGKSLRFAFLPEGQDPDDLVKSEGPGAFQKIIDAAVPLADVLWDRERDAQPLTTPERKAAFRAHLRKLVAGIVDKDVKNAYGAYFKDRLGSLYQQAPRINPFQKQPFRPSGGFSGRGQGFGNKGYGGKGAYTQGATAETKAKIHQNSQHEALLVLILANHPALFERIEEEIMDLQLMDADLAHLLQGIVSALAMDQTLDIQGVKSHITKDERRAGTFEALLKNERLRPLRFARADAILEDAEAGWRNALSLHLHHGMLRQEVAEAANEAVLDDPASARWHAATSHRFAVVANGKVEQTDIDDGATPLKKPGT